MQFVEDHSTVVCSNKACQIDCRWRTGETCIDKFFELTSAVLELVKASNGTFLFGPHVDLGSAQAEHTYLVRGSTMIKKVVPLG